MRGNSPALGGEKELLPGKIMFVKYGTVVLVILALICPSIAIPADVEPVALLDRVEGSDSLPTPPDSIMGREQILGPAVGDSASQGVTEVSGRAGSPRGSVAGRGEADSANGFGVLWGVLLGGALSILGSTIATLLNAKQARKIRMDEVVAAKRVENNAKAYTHLKKIQWFMSEDDSFLRAKHYVDEYEEWFFGTRIFLPGKFPDKWISIRNGINYIFFKKQDQDQSLEDITKAKKRILDWTNEGIAEVYRDMNLEEIGFEEIEDNQIDHGLW